MRTAHNEKLKDVLEIVAWIAIGAFIVIWCGMLIYSKVAPKKEDSLAGNGYSLVTTAMDTYMQEVNAETVDQITSSEGESEATDEAEAEETQAQEKESEDAQVEGDSAEIKEEESDEK